MSPDPLIPLSSLRSILDLVVAAAAPVMGMAAIPWVVRLETGPWLAASLATAGMCGLTVRLAARFPASSGGGLGRTLGWALLFGLANVPVSFLAASSVHEPDLAVVPLAMLATIVGAPFGLGLGLLFGLVLSVPVAAFVRAWQRPSPDATDFVLVVCGVWLMLAVGVAALLQTPINPPEVVLWQVEVDPAQAWMLQAIAWLLGVVGAALAIVAGVRQLARRRFIARVARGLEPTWRLGEAPHPCAELERLPCLGQIVEGCDHVLLRREHAGESAYRSATSEWPVAWVPRAWLGRASLGRVSASPRRG